MTQQIYKKEATGSDLLAPVGLLLFLSVTMKCCGHITSQFMGMLIARVDPA